MSLSSYSFIAVIILYFILVYCSLLFLKFTRGTPKIVNKAPLAGEKKSSKERAGDCTCVSIKKALSEGKTIIHRASWEQMHHYQ